MKNLTLALSLLISLFFFACQEESALEPNAEASGPAALNPNTNNNQTNGKMSARIDGQPWRGQVVSGSYLNDIINLTGIAADGTVLTITLMDKGEGLYEMKNAEDGNAAYTIDAMGTEPAWTAADSGGTVNLSINENKKTFSGNFSMVMFRQSDSSTILIEEGLFEVPFETELPPPPPGGGGGSSSLSADVDGRNFTATNVTGLIAPGFGLSINGTTNQGQETIGLNVPEDIDPGTYEIGSIFSTINALYNADASGSNSFGSKDGGQLVISKHDKANKQIEGTFNFVGENLLSGDSVVVTNGTFRVGY